MNPARWFRFIVGALLIIGTANCSSNTLSYNGAVQTGPRTITVTEKDNGGRLDLHPDDVLMVRLESIPGTGYSWQVSRNDAAVFKLLDKPEYERRDKKALGGVEYAVFRFKAVARGSDLLEMRYRRAWEKEKEPLKTFRITVRIE